jgi:dCMP deaminase
MDWKKRQLKWDFRWLGLAEYVAGFSKDPSTKTGAVLVRPWDQSVASIGFNGFAKGMSDAPELYADRAKKYPRILHCEMNAREFCPERPQGYTLYTWPFLSCDRCSVHMINAGIARAVAPICPADQATRWGEALETTRKNFAEVAAPVECVELDFPGLLKLITEPSYAEWMLSHHR